MSWNDFPLVTLQVEACFTPQKSYFCNIGKKTLKNGVPKLGGYFNKTKDWALVQNAALAGGVKVELGLFRNVTKLNLTTVP